MLSELLTYITTPCPQYVRHMDYLDEVIAMKQRYERTRTAWQPHLEHTRRFVLSAAEKCRNRSKAVILGSGLLLDVPLDELSTMFQAVVLLDIVFLPEVRRSIKRYGNVRLVQHDVTNMAKFKIRPYPASACLTRMPPGHGTSCPWARTAGISQKS